MEKQYLTPKLLHFVECLEQVLKETNTESNLLPRVGQAMQNLVCRDNWLPDNMAQPHPEYYQQFLLYADPDDRFSVVSFVWGPGQSTPIHDHTVWGVIGMLRGAECSQNYHLAKDGKPQPSGDETELKPGDIEFVSPIIGDIHAVRNKLENQTSISIHAYGGNIGKIKRHVFPVDGGPAKDFISGYTN